MPTHGPRIPTEQSNAFVVEQESKEEPVNDVSPVVTTQPSTPATPAKKPSSRKKKAEKKGVSIIKIGKTSKEKIRISGVEIEVKELIKLNEIVFEKAFS